MIRKNQTFFNAIHILSDWIISLASYFLASWLYLDVIVNDSLNMAYINSFDNMTIVLALVYTLILIIELSCLGLYRSQRIGSLFSEYARIFFANGIGILLLTSLLFVFRLVDFSRGVLACFFVISTTLMCLKRFIMRIILHQIRKKGYNQKHVLVVGSGSLAIEYKRNIERFPSYGLTVNNYVGNSSTASKLGNYLGGFDKLESSLQDNYFDKVIVALELDELSHLSDIIRTCEKCGVKVAIIPFYNDIIPNHPEVEVIGTVKLYSIRAIALEKLSNAILKRSFDIFASAIALLLLSPLLILCYIGVKLSSPGPAIFKQERIGLDKKSFYMYKFRSMRVNNEQDVAWSQNTDNRKTKFGSLIRKTSLDELPQLFNVLIGDMSLVGPRPEIPHFVDQFKETIPLYMVKHQVRPGITGWAQVNGFRGDTSIEERVRCDIWYIENWSFDLDIRIIFRTIFGAMINQENIHNK